VTPTVECYLRLGLRLQLCDGYVAGDPRRFRRHLTEQVRVRDLREAAARKIRRRGGAFTRSG